MSRKHEHIEHVVQNGRIYRFVILQQIERGPAGVVQGNNLSIDDSFVRKGSKGSSDGRIFAVEILVVSRPKLNAAARFESNCPVPVQFEFVGPSCGFR